MTTTVTDKKNQKPKSRVENYEKNDPPTQEKKKREKEIKGGQKIKSNKTSK
ncbi:hypothetical protein [Mesomycoplasma hyopneumoniae]